MGFHLLKSPTRLTLPGPGGAMHKKLIGLIVVRGGREKSYPGILSRRGRVRFCSGQKILQQRLRGCVGQSPTGAQIPVMRNPARIRDSCRARQGLEHPLGALHLLEGGSEVSPSWEVRDLADTELTDALLLKKLHAASSPWFAHMQTSGCRKM